MRAVRRLNFSRDLAGVSHTCDTYLMNNAALTKAVNVTNNTKAQAWDDGYQAGRNAGGSKGIPTNPCEGTEAEQAWIDGYSIGLDDAWQCAKTGRQFENPYR